MGRGLSPALWLKKGWLQLYLEAEAAIRWVIEILHHPMAVSTSWDSFRGCRCKKSPIVFGVYIRPPDFRKLPKNGTLPQFLGLLVYTVMQNLRHP